MTQMIPQIVSAVRSVIGSEPVGLHEPVLGAVEKQLLLEVLESGYVSSVGTAVCRFEEELAEYVGVKYAVATVNGTSALHAALLLAGVRPGDEVLLPALSFIATANAISYCGATPHFLDIEESSLGMDPAAMHHYLGSISRTSSGETCNRHTGRRIAAVIPVHTFGHMAEVESIVEVAEAHGLAVIEDSAEALGTHRSGKYAGTFGQFGVLSFNGNKIVTSGGGGALLTDDGVLADQARHLTATSRVAHSWEFVHDAIGFNYRMPGINAALGSAQLSRVEDLIANKRRLYRAYAREFAERGIRGARLFKEPKGTRSNYWLQTILLDEPDKMLRNELLDALNQAGWQARPAWKLLPEQPPYVACPSAPVPTAQAVVRRAINIPSGPGISV